MSRGDLRGPKVPLFHGTARIREIFRNLQEHAADITSAGVKRADFAACV